MSAKQGLYANCYIGTYTTEGTANVVALLTGVELSYKQEAKRFFPLGSLLPADVFTGPIAWEGSFKKAYVSNRFPGTLNLGTYILQGSITPLGTHTPAILGTLKLTGGNIANMNAESVDPVVEENTFIIYNLKFLS